MEHLTDTNVLSQRTGCNDNLKLTQLIDYANSIYSENKKYNLTGHKTIEDIIENLIVGSLEPVKNLIVPRGTIFADIGTGAGIPGIPLAIKYNECQGILFDSNQKKIRFINKTAAHLKISNVKGVDTRVEDAGRLSIFRSQFDIVVTRAMSDIYTIAELASPLLKIGGYIFLYINNTQIEFSDYLMEHLTDIGLSVDTEISSKNISGNNIAEGLILTKIKETDEKYPRRMPVIKRMATK